MLAMTGHYLLSLGVASLISLGNDVRKGDSGARMARNSIEDHLETLRQAIRNGNPEMMVPRISGINIIESAEFESSFLGMANMMNRVSNVSIVGLDMFNTMSFDMDREDMLMALRLHYDELMFHLHYDSQGDVLDVPIGFAGAVGLMLEDIIVQLFMDIKDLEGDTINFDSFNVGIMIGRAYMVLNSADDKEKTDVEVDVKPIVDAVTDLTVNTINKVFKIKANELVQKCDPHQLHRGNMDCLTAMPYPDDVTDGYDRPPFGGKPPKIMPMDGLPEDWWPTPRVPLGPIPWSRKPNGQTLPPFKGGWEKPMSGPGGGSSNPRTGQDK